MNRFQQTLSTRGIELRHTKTEILQINVGKLCNLTCNHCHVNAGPKRKEIMTRGTIDRIVAWLAQTDISTVDITGGAPELIPDFQYLIERIKGLDRSRHIIDRCNLTVLLEPGHEDLPAFLARHEVEIIASLPCYSVKNVDAQRGDGVFAGSIRALQLLNGLGYGTNPKLPLHVVYNPSGAFLPAPQAGLEAAYKAELKEQFDIVFNRLLTIANMPIARFAAWLRHHRQYDDYMNLLVNSFNPATVAGLMCRNTLSIGWRGEVYDCDFNQMLNLQWQNGRPLYLWDIEPSEVENRTITTGDHCFGCTAGCGSSCSGALVNF
jgi:radical SAM/Cys-rich protein